LQNGRKSKEESPAKFKLPTFSAETAEKIRHPQKINVRASGVKGLATRHGPQKKVATPASFNPGKSV
jgi:hypothetical protein